VLGLETLETRTMMSAASLLTSPPPVEAGDTVIPVHAQVGSTALERILGVAAKLDTVEDAINAYLNGIPGWHLVGGIDETPSYCGMLDGSIVVGANGLLKSASMTLSGSADIGGTIEGYYGTSVLHVGLGAAADLSANINATACFSVVTNTWEFGGSASLVGYVQGYATAMAWPLKGEVYVRGELEAAAGIDSHSGIASASLELEGSVGAKAQLKSLFGGWTTIASVSRSLGSWEGSASFDVGAWIKSQTNNIVTANLGVIAQSVFALFQGKLTPSIPGASTTASSTLAGYTNAPTATVGTPLTTSVAETTGTSLATPASRSVYASTTYRVDPPADFAFAPLNTRAVQEVFNSGWERV
jgi:hypothetical protein